MVDYYSVKREKKNLAQRNTFTKGDRLLQRYEFQKLSRTGKRIQSRCFIAYICINHFNVCRLGTTVTRKVGNAVTRNRIKRLTREYFRQNRHNLDHNWDISLIAKREIADIPNKKILLNLDHVFSKIASVKPE